MDTKGNEYMIRTMDKANKKHRGIYPFFIHFEARRKYAKITFWNYKD